MSYVSFILRPATESERAEEVSFPCTDKSSIPWAFPGDPPATPLLLPGLVAVWAWNTAVIPGFLLPIRHSSFLVYSLIVLKHIPHRKLKVQNLSHGCLKTPLSYPYTGLDSRLKVVSPLAFLSHHCFLVTTNVAFERLYPILIFDLLCVTFFSFWNLLGFPLYPWWSENSQ